MDNGVASNVFDGQLVTRFVCVYGFMLCAVIAENSLDVGDKADGPYIAQKQAQTDDAFQQVAGEAGGYMAIHQAK